MSLVLRFSDEALADLSDIWNWTVQNFDHRQADEYFALLDQALNDIHGDPNSILSRAHPELGSHIRSYHLESSKRGSRVNSPRHLVYYTLDRKDEIFVLRILHERMEPHRYL